MLAAPVWLRARTARLLVPAGLVLTLACARSRPRVDLVGPTGGEPHLTAGERICVAGVEDAHAGSRQYGGSGQLVATRTAQALRPRFANVQILSERNDRALAACRAHRGRHVVIPTILRWEEPATGWSGTPDVVQVRLVLRDVAAATEPRELVFQAQTRRSLASRAWNGVLQSGGLPAARLLDDQFDAAVWALVDGSGVEHRHARVRDGAALAYSGSGPSAPAGRGCADCAIAPS